MFRSRQSAFTLIELLIVVAIIAILAAIAVPNFLEAQTRSKVSRVKSDHRTLTVALESYRVDNNNYIIGWFNDQQPAFPIGLSTPVAYLSSISSAYDIFNKTNSTEMQYKVHIYVPFKWRASLPGSDMAVYKNNSRVDSLILYSHGPDQIRDWSEYFGPYGNSHPDQVNYSSPKYYDPTNGTVSVGDIIRYMP